MAFRAPSSIGVSRAPRDVRGAAADKVRTLVQGFDSEDFAFSVVCKNGTWFVSYSDREAGETMPSFGSGPTFAEAFRKAGLP